MILPAVNLRARLILGFSAIFVLFAIGSAVVLEAVGRARAATEEMNQREEGVRFGLTMASCAREQYVHEAHLLITADPEHVEHFREAVRTMTNCQEHVRMAVSSPEERGWMREIDEAADRFRGIFFQSIVPALERGQKDDAIRSHKESEELLNAIVDRNNRINAAFLGQIEAAKGRASSAARRAQGVTAAVLAAALLLSAAIALHLGRSITRPIHALVAGTERVGGGDLRTRIRLDSRDEFAALAESFNRMTGELGARQEELLRAEKLASLGQLAAGVAHQLNNPLAVILGYVRLLREPDARGRAELDEQLAIVEEETRECQGIVRSLLTLARPGTLMPETVDLRELVEEALRHFRRYHVPTGVEVHLQVPSQPLPVRTDRDRLRQAVLNLLMNGAEAMPGGGLLGVSCRRVARNGRTATVLSVQDEGVGIPREALGRIFDPYFSTKRGGTGLGLTLTHGIVKALGGWIRAESEVGRGSRFTIVLPEEAPAADGEAAS